MLTEPRFAGFVVVPPPRPLLLHFPPLQGARLRAGGEVTQSRNEEKACLLLSFAPKAGVIQIISVGAAQLSPCPVNPI